MRHSTIISAFPSKENHRTCLDLAESEKILKGRLVELAGPFKYENTEFNPEEEESDENPKFKEYSILY